MSLSRVSSFPGHPCSAKSALPASLIPPECRHTCSALLKKSSWVSSCVGGLLRVVLHQPGKDGRFSSFHRVFPSFLLHVLQIARKGDTGQQGRRVELQQPHDIADLKPREHFLFAPWLLDSLLVNMKHTWYGYLLPRRMKTRYRICCSFFLFKKFTEPPEAAWTRSYLGFIGPANVCPVRRSCWPSH